MSLKGWLDSLERQAKESGLLDGHARCSSCGWPVPGAERFVTFQARRHGEQLPKCPDCGHETNRDGSALGGVGTVIVVQGIFLEGLAPEGQ